MACQRNRLSPKLCSSGRFDLIALAPPAVSPTVLSDAWRWRILVCRPPCMHVHMCVDKSELLHLRTFAKKPSAFFSCAPSYQYCAAPYAVTAARPWWYMGWCGWVSYLLLLLGRHDRPRHWQISCALSPTPQIGVLLLLTPYGVYLGKWQNKFPLLHCVACIR